MSDACFIATDVDVPVGGLLRLDGPEGRHAAKVRRIRVGESVLIMDGRGHAVRGPAEVVGAESIDVRVVEQLSEPVSPNRWIAVQALAKAGRGELAIEALTELGANEFVAWGAARSIVQWQGKIDKGIAKFAATAREAAKQTRRFTIPQVEYATTAQVCERIRAASMSVVLHESATDWLDATFTVPPGDVLFVIGPEGGITPDELAAFQDAGAVVKRVAQHVLKTSTAGVVALAQLQVLVK